MMIEAILLAATGVPIDVAPVIPSEPEVAAPEVDADGEAETEACAVDGASETDFPPAADFAFVIPGTEPDAAQEPLPPCIPAPVRPRDLHIFGFYALPVGPGGNAARWQDGHLLDLPESDPRVLTLTWGLDRPGVNPLDEVNRRVNAALRYVDDPAGDDWASAATTLARGYGDCEDFAVVKLALLAQAGFDSDDLFLVIVRDNGRNIDHAVAAVRWQTRLWVLDNRLDRIQPAERVMDYVPLQSYSGQWAWTYGYKPGGSAARAVRAAFPQSGR